MISAGFFLIIEIFLTGKSLSEALILVSTKPRYDERLFISRVSNIESDNSQNVGLEDYNNISDRIFPHFTTPSIKISLG